MKPTNRLLLLLFSLLFCFPSVASAKYVWIGKAPFCKGKKSDCTKRGMRFVRFDKRGGGKKCWSGKKVLCKTVKKRPSRRRSTPSRGMRQVWVGTAPFCKGKKSDCTKRGMRYVRSSKRGTGKKCLTGRKVLCEGKALSTLPGGTWIGRAPFCNGRPVDCAYKGKQFIQFDKYGDGKKCSTGRKVYCAGRFRTPPGPYFVIAHMTNTSLAVRWAVKKGANALEMDLQFTNSGKPRYFQHGGNCDCYPIVTAKRGVCNALYTSATRKGIRKRDRACRVSELPGSLLGTVAKMRNVALIIIDSKLNNKINLPRAGYNVVKALDRFLFARGYRGQVIIGSAKAKFFPYLEAAAGAAGRSRYRNRYFFGIDEETKVGRTIEKLRSIRNTNNVVYGTGVTALLPKTFYNEIVVAAKLEMKRKSAFTYIWTLDKTKSMKKYIKLGARGIMTNDPAKAYSLMKRMRLRLATPSNSLRTLPR